MNCPLCNGAGTIEIKQKDPHLKERIENLFGHGLSYQKIADALGIHKSTVYYYVRRYKMVRRDLIVNPATRDILAQGGIL